METKFVKIKDYYEKEILVKVSKDVYQVFDEERRLKERMRNERRRHLDMRPLDDFSVKNKTVLDSLEELCMQRERLRRVSEVLEKCTLVQRERFYLNRVCGYTYAEIGEMQECTARCVGKSVESVMKKIKKSDR